MAFLKGFLEISRLVSQEKEGCKTGNPGLCCYIYFTVLLHLFHATLSGIADTELPYYLNEYATSFMEFSNYVDDKLPTASFV